MFEWLTWLRDLVCGPPENEEDGRDNLPPEPDLGPIPCSIQEEIPICGNSWVTRCRKSRSAGALHLTEDGCGNWVCPDTVWSIFFRMSKPETINIALRLRIPPRSQSTLKFTLASEQNENRKKNVEYEINITDPMGGEYQNIQVGQCYIEQPGYVRFNLQGMKKSGEDFAQVSHLLLGHNDPGNQIVFNSTEDSYFGRRGPSVHLCYDLPGDKYPTEYFYNEVTIPPGSDALGLYAMAIGFSGGYFGIQVNGPNERRVLFSVWSEFNTEDPSQIPEEYKVSLIRKGHEVYDGEFGNEGSGAQSYVQFTWRTGTVYKFLVHAKPVEGDRTLYEGWFKEPDSDEWELVAAFCKPKVGTYLKDVYSFLENFEPDQGHLERTAHYGNQWARDCYGEWREITKAKFTGDATSQAGRKDFAGGVVCEGGNCFYLRHCGFFSEYTPTNQRFERCGGCNPPEVDVNELP